MSKEVSKLRQDTPGLEHVIHFNNAGCSLPPKPVTDAQKAFLDREATIGGYEACTLEAEALRLPYEALARLINCSPSEIAVVCGATQAWTQVFYGIQFREGDRVLTSLQEYGSNYIAFLQVAKRQRIRIEVIPETPEGDISLAALEKLILEGDRTPALIAITHIPTNSGRVYDAVGVGEVARRYGIPYLLDACQSVGQMPIDVKKIGCDWLSATARKFLRGPRGMGFLYASREAMQWSEPAVIDNLGAEWTAKEAFRLVDNAQRYEVYERSMSAQVGFGVAVEYALDVGLEWIWARNQRLATLLRDGLRSIPGVRVHDHGRQLCSIVSFSKDGLAAREAVGALQKQGMNLSVSAITSTRLDFEARKLPPSVLRASVHYYNTEEEVQNLVAAVRNLNPAVLANGKDDKAFLSPASLLMGSLFRKTL